MRVKTLFQDDDYTLVQGRRFGITHDLLCPIYVVLADTGDAIKATLPEKLFFLDVGRRLVKLGAALPGDTFDELFLRFSNAVANRGSMRWHLFFQDGDAQQRAAELLR
ncbi:MULTISPECIES: hypothetical protein [unclassified Rhodanobacter]|uniref:Uncharacterized protein n=1 Tax=Rhodanobacter humi TaxID=1888173 RepID=A0ABV4AUD7_9GAMM